MHRKLEIRAIALSASEWKWALPQSTSASRGQASQLCADKPPASEVGKIGSLEKPSAGRASSMLKLSSRARTKSRLTPARFREKISAEGESTRAKLFSSLMQRRCAFPRDQSIKSAPPRDDDVRRHLRRRETRARCAQKSARSRGLCEMGQLGHEKRGRQFEVI